MRLRSGQGRGGSDRAREALERRYRDLMARYRVLLERLKESARTDWAFHRLSWFALQRSSSAVAMFRDGIVVMANPHWYELASARKTPCGWAILGEKRRPYPDLGTLGATELERLSARDATMTLRCRRDNSSQVIRLRLERIAPPGETPIGFVLADDITEQQAHENEMTTLREEMKRKEQMSALGRLAAGVTHDVGNTLNALALRVELLARAVDETGTSHLREINEAVAVMRSTLDRLDRFSGRGARPARPIDVAAVIRSAINVAGLALPLGADAKNGRVVVDVRLPARLPRVIGDAPELTNVLVNLLINARDALAEGGTIRVMVSSSPDFVTVSVRDNGPGFPPDQLSRVFEPFFTTKGALGSGLGLSLAYALVESLGGRVRAGNRPEGGAEVVLELPRARRVSA
jgi:signal transduction histidine kinase